MTIEWSRLAVSHIESLYRYVAIENSIAADALMERVFSAVEALARYPQMGRGGKVNGTRELVIPGTHYIVAYRAEQGQVAVLAVLHTSRKWPGGFQED